MKDISAALRYLQDCGWSELIASEWTLETKRCLEESDIPFDGETIAAVLDLVIYPKPDYDINNNRQLIR